MLCYALKLLISIDRKCNCLPLKSCVLRRCRIFRASSFSDASLCEFPSNYLNVFLMIWSFGVSFHKPLYHLKMKMMSRSSCCENNRPVQHVWDSAPAWAVTTVTCSNNNLINTHFPDYILTEWSSVQDFVTSSSKVADCNLLNTPPRLMLPYCGP